MMCRRSTATIPLRITKRTVPFNRLIWLDATRRIDEGGQTDQAGYGPYRSTVGVVLWSGQGAAMNSKTASGKRRVSIGARRSPETETAILDAAEALLREGGLAGFSIEGVARRARAGKPTIYRWWPNKTRLLLDVY